MSVEPQQQQPSQYTNHFSATEKVFISRQIKHFSTQHIIDDFEKLQQIGASSANMSSRCRTGNNVVDHFTFCERLNTRGKYNANYFDFVSNIDDFKTKRFISNMLTYYDDVKNKNRTKNSFVVLKEVFNICISAINIFRPIVAMDMYNKYSPHTVLDFTCGWGGRMIGACALNVPKYIGIDINANLSAPHKEMCRFVKNNTTSTTDVEIRIEDAVNVDYSKITYDMVLTSPPYFFIEKYSNNVAYPSKSEMVEIFYTPLFLATYAGLSPRGVYCLNVNVDIYESVCVPALGIADEAIPLKKSKRQNKYTEFIYVWKKPDA